MRILEGDRALSKDNRVLGTLQIDNLPMARAGIPKIEVRFDIDASGLLRVSATDSATKKITELQCSDLVLPERRLNEYHSLVQKWIRQRSAHLRDDPATKCTSQPLSQQGQFVGIQFGPLEYMEYLKKHPEKLAAHQKWVRERESKQSSKSAPK